jgi:GH25 family lysozyme M1 (1,4-beta-N-acetylmuramidase)
VTANGIDVSNNNGKLSLTTGMAGLEFVIAKCTEGTTYVDTAYNWYQTQTVKLGIHFGAYHFFHAENNDAAHEADWFIRHAALKPGMSVWIDYETYGLSGETDLAQLALFGATVKNISPVTNLGLYANLTGFKRLGNQGVQDVFNDFWLASPTGVAETPDTPLAEYSLSWLLHQYEVFNGVDRDYSRIGGAALTELWAKLWEEHRLPDHG